jgi:hypothetical protein
VANTGQADADNDGYGNLCDLCPAVSDPDQFDTDADLVGNACDNCASVSNLDQANNDGDAQGDACDPDDDNDAVADGSDNCPLAANPGQENLDGDAQGDACDPDDDNDGLLDTVETNTGCTSRRRTPARTSNADTDADGWSAAPKWRGTIRTIPIPIRTSRRWARPARGSHPGCSPPAGGPRRR